MPPRLMADVRGKAMWQVSGDSPPPTQGGEESVRPNVRRRERREDKKGEERKTWEDDVMLIFRVKHLKLSGSESKSAKGKT